MNFDKLTHFSHIYETKSITKASEHLKLSKTALSLSLKSLEEELESQLFTRSNKQMLPTSEGNHLYQKISPILLQLTEVKREMKFGSKVFSGTIRVGAPICFGSEMLAPFINEFRKQYPKASFDMTLDAGEEIKKKLMNGELDFAIVGDDVRLGLPPSVHLEKIFEYELILCSSRKFFEQHLKGEKVTFSRLSALPFISLMHVSHQDWFNVHFNQAIELPRNFKVNNHHVHITQLLNSQGLGVQSRFSVREFLRCGDLVEIRPTARKVKYAFYGVQFYNQVPTRVLKEFIGEFRRFLAEMK